MCQPQRVVCHGVLAFGRSIRSPFSENVSYSRARDNEELPAAHPDLARSKDVSTHNAAELGMNLTNDHCETLQDVLSDTNTQVEESEGIFKNYLSEMN
jgi:hypothetical protein